MRSYITLLGRYPLLLRLSVIQLSAYFAVWFTNVAIYTKLVEINASAFMISLVTAIHFLPAVIQAPFIGPLIDRFDPKKLMLTLLLTETTMTFFLLFFNSLSMIWFLLLVLYIRMSAASFYFTAEMSLLPKVLSGEELQKANELHSLIWSFSFTTGMALSGIFVSTFGTFNAILIDAFMFVFLLGILFTTRFPSISFGKKEAVWVMLKEGIRYIVKHPTLFKIILLHASVALTIFDTIVTLLADMYYKNIVAVALAIGFINASRALGLMMGTMILSRFTNDKTLLYLFILQGAVIIIWGSIQHNFYLSLIGSFFVGFFTTMLWSYTYTMLQKETEQSYYGRVIAYNDMFFMLVSVITSVMIGVLANNGVALNVITYIIGIGFLVTALFYALFLKEVR